MEIPNEIAERLDWTWLIADCQNIEGLSASERRAAAQALSFLSQELGTDFLRQAWTGRHPIIRAVLDGAGWIRKWMTWLADALKGLRVCTGYPFLRGKLIGAETYPEAISILEPAYRFLEAGFEPSFEQDVLVNGTTKRPDIAILHRVTKDLLYVEVSVLEESDRGKAAWGSFEAITQLLMFGKPDLKHAGRLFKTLSSRHLEHVEREIQRTLEQADKERSFRELRIPGVVELAVAPKASQETLDAWAQQRGIKVGEFYGPDDRSDELRRAANKIGNEQFQLPRDHAGVVIVDARESLFFREHLEAIVGELEEAVYRHPHLLAAVVAGEHLGHADDTATKIGQHLFVTRKRFGVLVNQYLVLVNRFRDVEVQETTLDALMAAFRDV